MSTYYVSRAAWAASPLLVEAGHAAPSADFVGLVLHHTVSNWAPSSAEDDVAGHMRTLQRSRPDLGAEIPYSWVVLEHPDPRHAWVAEGRGHGRTGAHTIGYNATRYGVALAGDYTARPITLGMIAAIRDLAALHLVDPAAAEAAIAHRDVYATACPGDAATAQLAALQPPYTFTDNGDAMPLTEPDLVAVASAVLDHPITLRQYAGDRQRFTEEPATIQGAAIFGHAEAQLAHLAADAALAAVGAMVTGLNSIGQQLAAAVVTLNSLAIGQARQSATVEALAAAVKASGAPAVPSADDLTVALVAALQAIAGQVGQ